VPEPKPKRVRYRLEEGDTTYTPSQVKRLGKEKQAEIIRTWFNANFEDPVQEMPRDDGDYFYPYGGPFDANSVIQDEFGDLISYAVMESVIEDLESEGLSEWAPTSGGRFYDRPRDDDYEFLKTDPLETLAIQVATRPLKFADPEARAAVKVLLERVDVLERELEALKQLPPGIGHNGGPEDDEASAPEGISVAQATADVAYVKTELREPEPDAVGVVKAVSRLSRFGAWLRGATYKLSAKAVEKAGADMIVDVGRRVATSDAVSHAVHGVVEAATRWGHAILSLL